MPEWFGMRELAFLVFVAWIFFAVAYLPKMIRNERTLPIVALLGGCLLAWVADVAGPRPPYFISIAVLLAILATLLGMVHAEIIFRRENGYWRIVGRGI